MTSKLVIPRASATRDAEDALEYYLLEAGEQIAVAFIDALEEAFSRLARYPSVGSNRYAHELNLPGLRSWPLSRFPWLIFYVDSPDSIDVWRILHQRRNIPDWMQKPE